MIFVESEFAPLQKVVLAESEFGYPEEVRKEDLRFLERSAITDSIRNRGKDYSEAHPDLQLRWECERKKLKEVLEKYGVEVLLPGKLTSAEKRLSPKDGYSNFFTRDPFFVIGNFVIEGALRFLHRRNEILPLRNILLKEVSSGECVYVSVPKPDMVSNDGLIGENSLFIEGGDVLVLGKQIFVGNSGLATNDSGIQWLYNLLAPSGYSVETVRLHPDILHLDCALGLVKENLMVVCEDAFLDGIPDKLANWKRISVTLEEARELAVNGLPVSEEVYITDPAFEHIGKQIEEEGIRVEYIDFTVSRSFGGSFRCSTQAFIRHEV